MTLLAIIGALVVLYVGVGVYNANRRLNAISRLTWQDIYGSDLNGL